MPSTEPVAFQLVPAHSWVMPRTWIGGGVSAGAGEDGPPPWRPYADLHADGTRRGAHDQAEQAGKLPRPAAHIVREEAQRAPQERWDGRRRV